MGQTLSVVIGNLIVFFYKLSESTKTLFSGERKEKSYYNNDIILKDDEQKADILSSEEINKIIKKQQNIKRNTPQDVNLNEYKIIKNTTDIDDSETFGERLTTPLMKEKEIQEIQKEVINLHIEDDKEEEHVDESIDDLKASILNHDI